MGNVQGQHETTTTTTTTSTTMRDSSPNKQQHSRHRSSSKRNKHRNSRHRHRHHHSNDNDSEHQSTEDLDTLIKQARNELRQRKIEGVMTRDAQEEEIYALQTQLYQKRKRLLDLARRCQDAFSFSDYINIIQTTYSSDDIATMPVNTIIPEDGQQLQKQQQQQQHHESPKTREMVPQHFTLTYTIFAWFEAYLLKRLHMAMLQQRQMNIHSKTWSGVVADLYFQIPLLKKNFETNMGSLFVRKQTVAMEKHQKQNAYAEHVRLQARTIMKLEKASWDENEDEVQLVPTKSSSTGPKVKRTSLPAMINIADNSTQRSSGTSGTFSPSTSGRDSTISAYTEVSDGATELGKSLSQIKESPYSARSNHNHTTTTIVDPHGFESDITESSDEEDSVYASSIDEHSVDQQSAIAVKALNAQPQHRISALTVPKDFHWHAEVSEQQREEMRKQAEIENARLERERFLQRTRELQARNSFDSGGPLLTPQELERAESGESKLSKEELGRLKRLEQQRKDKERQRSERAAFKAARLRDLQNRLERTSGHSATSSSPLSFLSGTSSGSTAPASATEGGEGESPSAVNVVKRLLEKTEIEVVDTTPAVVVTTKSKKKHNKHKQKNDEKAEQEPKKEPKKEHKHTTKSKKRASTDDRSVGSRSSMGSRKSAKRKSAMAAEKRAEEKMAQLSQIMADKDLESFVQEKEAKNKASGAADNNDNNNVPSSPGGSVSSRASRQSQRSLRLEQTIRKAEEKAAKKLEELALLTDNDQ
ncbi:unnamed protein product [Cylindrotheca closterium]|uniref:Uncharacterized protein n=1 Tax=Cylindrotheca closterium TaxID=2856 RepID=A0AAD2GCN2_9STRA|nr:unnamed protein product [Cylindrotheca closterium]